jgi:hypothetical protein
LPNLFFIGRRVDVNHYVFHQLLAQSLCWCK